MEGAKRNADSMDKTSFITNNNNNVPNATEIPTGSSSGSQIYDSFVPIRLPPLPYYSTLGAYSNIPPSWRNTGNFSSVRPALGSSSSNQPAEIEGSLTNILTSENEERHSKKICLENRDGERFQPSNQANDVIPTSNYLSELERTTAGADSSSSAGNATSSAVENPPPVAAIEFGGRIIPATPVQLVPVMNPEPQPSAFSVPPTPQATDFTTYMNMKSRQYAERAYYTSPTIMAPSQAEDILGEEEDGAVAPGLTEEQIVNAMKTEKYKPNTTTTDSSCPICWDEMGMTNGVYLAEVKFP
uniref:Uncharacterized protein n=1 Tax=Chenopodium quinoa TaxID=63459 RepID=A0A803KSA4_CHEQI